MAQTTTLKALTGYFNTGENKKPLKDFAAELKALTDDEKRELALGVVAVTGDTLA
jgi:hypothetical protein